MKEKQEFYKIEALISKEDTDKIKKELKSGFASVSGIIFNALRNSGITVYEVSSHSASARIQPARIQPKSITLDVSGNGESTTKKDFKSMI